MTGLSLDTEDTFETAMTRRDNPHRAYITIIEGCDKSCAYCVVPHVRGREVDDDPALGAHVDCIQCSWTDAGGDNLARLEDVVIERNYLADAHEAVLLNGKADLSRLRNLTLRNNVILRCSSFAVSASLIRPVWT